MSAISVSTGPAARGADGIRGSLVGPTRRLGARGSIHGNALVNGTVPRSKLDPYALQLRNRYAAKSLGGSSSTAGAFASFTWDPGQDVTVSFVYASAVAPSATVSVFGTAAAPGWNVRFLTTGEIQFREDTNQRAITAAGVAKYDGYSHTVSLRVTGTTVAITHDGVAVGSGTFSSVTWGSTTYFIGAYSSSGARWPGAIWNVEGTDHTTAANGFTFLMDEPPTSATFVNTLSGTSVGNATKGTGAAFPWVTSVASTDGRGMPFQGVGPLVYGATRGNTDQVLDGSVATRYSLTFDTEIADPTGSFVHTTGILTVPFAGMLLIEGDARLVWCGIASDPINIAVYKNGASQRARVYTATSASPTQYVSVSHAMSVAANDTVDLSVDAIDPTNTTLALDSTTLRMVLHPTPTTG